jgi:hypothetical protein
MTEWGNFFVATAGAAAALASLCLVPGQGPGVTGIEIIVIGVVVWGWDYPYHAWVCGALLADTGDSILVYKGFGGCLGLAGGDPSLDPTMNR